MDWNEDRAACSICFMEWCRLCFCAVNTKTINTTTATKPGTYDELKVIPQWLWVWNSQGQRSRLHGYRNMHERHITLTAEAARQFDVWHFDKQTLDWCLLPFVVLFVPQHSRESYRPRTFQRTVTSDRGSKRQCIWIEVIVSMKLYEYNTGSCHEYGNFYAATIFSPFNQKNWIALTMRKTDQKRWLCNKTCVTQKWSKQRYLVEAFGIQAMPVEMTMTIIRSHNATKLYASQTHKPSASL